MLAQHLTEYFEECPNCGKDGLKRSHSSLYEINGWLHLCKSEPLKYQRREWSKHESTVYQEDCDYTYQDDIVQCDRQSMGSEAGREGHFYRYSDAY